MKIWLLYPVLLASSGLLIFVVRCVLGLLAKHPPKMRALRSVAAKSLGVLMLLATAIGMLAVPKNPPLDSGVLNAPLRLMQRLAGDSPGSRLFTADELDARFVLQSVDTNADWSAAMLVGAVEPTTWPMTGAFKDKYENLSVGGWEFPYLGAFPFGTNEVTRMARRFPAAIFSPRQGQVSRAASGHSTRPRTRSTPGRTVYSSTAPCRRIP